MFPLICPIVAFVAQEVASKGVIDTFLTETGLQYNVESGIGALESEMGGLQSSVNVLSANVSEISQNVGQLGEGIAQQSMMLSSLQTSISAIGMMSAVGCTLSAVNVFQLIKVQRSLNRVEKKIDDGFIDLKAFFSEQLQNLLNEQQRQRLAQAYNHYRKACEQLQNSLLIQDPINKKLSINSCIDVFVQSLAIYDDKQEYQHINTPAKLRRLECSWSLEAAIAESRYLQGEYSAALHSYEKLRQRIMAETEMLKSEMRPDNFSFVGADLHWIFENDIKIINAKIGLLNHYLTHNRFEPIKIQASEAEQNENLFKNSKLSSAKLYIDCLISDQKADSVKKAVLENKSSFQDTKYDYIDFNKLPLLHFCDIHIELFGESHKFVESSALNTQIIQLLERYFLEKKDVNYKLTENEPQLKVFLSALDVSHSFEKEIAFFNKALKIYIEKATDDMRENRNLDKEKREKLKNIALELGLSEKFSENLSKMLAQFHKNNVNKYLAEHKNFLISLVISENSSLLSDQAKSALLQFEQNILLNKTELKENKRTTALLFFDTKNAIILNNKFNEINENNEILVWKTQDKLQISEAQSKTFINGCQKSIQQYQEAFKTLSAGKKQLSAMDKSVLQKIQGKNDLSGESIKKITGKGSFFKRFW